MNQFQEAIIIIKEAESTIIVITGVSVYQKNLNRLNNSIITTVITTIIIALVMRATYLITNQFDPDEDP